MKTIKQIREEYDNQVLDQLQNAPDELVLEGRESSAIKPMPKTVPSTSEMPTMLMFRRIAYRIYPNKQVVALYYSKYVDKYLSIPFGPGGNLNLSEAVVHDEVELEEGAVGDIARGAIAGHIVGATAGLPGAVAGTLAGAGYGAYKAYKKAKTKEKKDMKEDWSDAKYKNPEGSLTKAGVMKYRSENPGSKLQTAVTTKPSKLKKGSKAANRRKSFCARMGGMKKRLTSAKTARDPDSRINKALRKWNCEESFRQKLNEKRQLREEQQINEFATVLGRMALSAGAGEAIYQGAKQVVKKAPAIASKAKDVASRFMSKFRKGSKETPRDPSSMTKSSKTPKTRTTPDVPVPSMSPSSQTPSGSPSDSEPAIVRLKPGTPSRSSMKAKSSRDFAPHGGLSPTQQSKYTANILAKENKISEIQNMINEGMDNMDLSINGRTVTLNNSMAKKIIRVYESVNTKNKKIVENMLNEDLDSFKKLLNFSIKA
jgi:hypothetical protein